MKYLVLFDGECALCQGTVRVLTDLDRHQRLHYAALSGATAAAVRAHHPALPQETRTMILVEDWGGSDETIWTESDAVLRTGAALGGIYKIGLAALTIPASWRNAVYRWIARNRYRWFGKSNSCGLMSPELRRRVLP